MKDRVIKISLILALILGAVVFSVGVFANSPPEILCEVAFDEPEVWGVAVDSHDNIIVTGDEWTAKYDSSCNLAWKKEYTATYGNFHAVAVDPNDNIIVAGENSDNLLIVKYSPTGTQLWRKAFDFGGNDEANGVATDSRGNIIAVGDSLRDSEEVWIVVKCEGNGDEIWRDTYSYSYNQDEAYAVATDSNDNIIVTGYSEVTGGFYPDDQFLTIKYTPNGDRAWAKKYGTTGTCDNVVGNWAQTVAVDSQGNIIIGGASENADKEVIKYDRNGNISWEQDLDQGAEAAVVDSADNIIIAAGPKVYKLTPNKDQLWEIDYRSGYEATGVAVDSSDSIIAAGRSSSGGIIIKYGYGVGSFTGSNFSCACAAGGEIRCSLNYNNQLGEKAQVLFLFSNCETGRVIDHALPQADQGTGTVHADFDCPPNQPARYCINWQAYRESDSNLENPVAWSRSYEEQEVVCPCVADDHGNDPAHATLITPGQTLNGNIEQGGDIDFFRFSPQADCTYRLETSLGTLDDTVLALYDANGNKIDENDDFGTSLASRIDWTAPNSNTYYASVRAYGSSATGTYTFSLSEIGCKQLDHVTVSGPNSVQGTSGNTANYTCTAYFTDSSSSNVTSSATWSETLAHATISGGTLTVTGNLTSNESGQVSCSYTYNGVTKSNSKSVTLTALGGAMISINPSTVSVTPGGTATFDVAISGLTNGLQRVNVSLSISSNCAADLTNVSNGNLPRFNYLTTSGDISTDKKSVRLVAFTYGTYTGSGGTIYTLTVAGKSSGNTSCTITITKNGISDKDGNDITSNVTVQNGTLNVQSGPPAAPGQGHRPIDHNSNGAFEDVNGDGTTDYRDYILLARLVEGLVSGGPAYISSYGQYFNFNNTGSCDYHDYIKLARIVEGLEPGPASISPSPMMPGDYSQAGIPQGKVFSLVLQEAPQGLAVYKLVLSVNRGKIEGVKLLTLTGIGAEIAPDGRSVLIAGVDFSEAVGAGARDVRLAQIWVSGTDQVKVEVRVEKLMSDGGMEIGSSLLEVRPVEEPLVVEDVLAYPNPVTGTGGVHFVVEGRGIAGMEVMVYDLSGKLVYDSGLVMGKELSWGLIDDAGEPLANGVYLYLVTVRGVEGTTLRSKVRKLVVLR